jgi:2-dehydro-3-deoxyglucarate aldolase
MPADSNDDVRPSRHNGLRATIERGSVALGVLDDTDSPELVELYGDLGFEFV